MSVPTIFAAVSGKAISITRPKRVPLPTDVEPDDEAADHPRQDGDHPVAVRRMNGLSSGLEWRYALMRNATPQTISAAPRIALAVSS